MAAAENTSEPVLVRALNKCQTIYVSSADDYAAAPEYIQELIDTCGYLHTVLNCLRRIHGDIYPLRNVFLDKLNECEQLIEDYKALKHNHKQTPSPGIRRQPTLTDRVRHSWDQAIQTGKKIEYALEGREKRAKTLNTALSVQIQNLVLFFVAVGLNPGVPRPIAPTPTLPPLPPRANSDASGKDKNHRRRSSRSSRNSRSSTSSYHGPQPPETEASGARARDLETLSKEIGATFAEINEELQLLRNRYERTTSTAAQHKAPKPDLTDLKHDLERVRDTLCATVRLPEEHRPAVSEDFLTKYASMFSNVLVNTDRSPVPSQPRPLFPGMDAAFAESGPSSAAVTPASTWSAPPPQSTAQTTPASVSRQKPPSFRTLCLPEPAHYIASVPLEGPDGRRFTATLETWKCEVHGQVKTIVWTAKTPMGILRHDVPLGVFPTTLHAMYKKPLLVRFLPGQTRSLEWVGADGIPHQQERVGARPVDYTFTASSCERHDECERHEVFQSDVRGQDLLKTFSTTKIWSNRAPEDHGGEAMMAVVKLWHDRSPPYAHTLTFLNGKERRIMELPLACFSQTVREDADPKHFKTVFLDVAGAAPALGPAPAPAPEPSSPKSTKSRSMSFRRSTRAKEKSVAHSKRGSVESTESEIATSIVNSGNNNNENHSQYAEVLGGITWLAIYFKDKPQDAALFTKEFGNAWQQQANQDSLAGLTDNYPSYSWMNKEYSLRPSSISLTNNSSPAATPDTSPRASPRATPASSAVQLPAFLESL